MPKRNFDNYAIIQRLQNRIYARNIYINNTTGQSIINNPQTTDGSSSRMASYRAGAQTEYYRGLNGGETISEGGSLIILPFTVPDAPISLTVAPSNGQVSISFIQGFYGRTPITNYHYSIDNGEFVAFSSVYTESPVVITGLTNGITYCIQLKAINIIGESVASDIIMATPIAVPFPPTNLIATPSNGEVSISFTTGFDEGNPIINYEYSINGSLFTPFHPADISNPIVIRDLENGKSYSIKLKAVNRIGVSLASNSIVAIPITVPSTPTNLNAIAGDKQISISFTQGFNGGSPIKWYEYSDDGGRSFAIIDSTDTISPVVIKNLTNGRTYVIKITANNNAGASIPSGDIIAKPVAVPFAPTILSAIPSNGQISISLTPGFDGGTPILYYQYSINNNPLFITTTTANTQIIKNLENGEKYDIVFRTINSVGSSMTSNSVSAIPVTIPSKPTNLRATATDRQVSIEYTEGFNGGSDFTNYEYSIENDPFVSTTAYPIVITTRTDGTLLNNGITYTIVLKAVTIVGKSVPSDPISFKPVTIPSKPTNLRATVSDRQISISFTEGFNGGSDFTNYEYSINNDPFVSTTAYPILITTRADGTLLNYGIIYTIVLKAVTIVGKSDVSESVSCKPVTLPSAPTQLEATPTNKQAIISFTEGFNGGSDFTNYAYSINDGSFNVFNPVKKMGPLVIADLDNGSTYRIRLKAITDVGESLASSEVSVIPYTVPSTPNIVSYLGRNRDIYIRIEQVSNGGRAIINYEYSTDNGENFRLFNPAITLVDNRYGDLYITTFSSNGTTQLTNGTPYNVQIRAVNLAGRSDATTSISITPATVPDPPTGLILTAGNKVLRIDFTQVSNGGSAIINYEYSTDDGTTFIEFSPVDKASPVIINKESTVGTPALVNGTPYSIKLKAKNSIGSSIASSTLPAMPYGVPSTPVITSTTGGDKVLNISFTQMSNGGREIINYEYSTDGGTTFIEFSPIDKASPVSITKESTVGTPAIVNGKTYYVQLRAVNSEGRSASSSNLIIRPETAPSAPNIYSITENNSELIILFTPGDNGGNPITSYIYRINGIETLPAQRIDIASITNNSITRTGLTNGVTYRFELKAITSRGESLYSNSVSGIPQFPGGPTIPSTPTITSVTIGARSSDTPITVNFTYGYHGGRPITGIYYKRSYGGTTVPANATVTKYFTYINWIMEYPTTSPIILYEWSRNDLYITFAVQVALENAIGRSAFSAPFIVFATPV